MYKLALSALNEGAAAMASPYCVTPIQARTELLSCIITLYKALREDYDLQDVLLSLSWLDGFARFPYSANDPAPVKGGSIEFQGLSSRVSRYCGVNTADHVWVAVSDL